MKTNYLEWDQYQGLEDKWVDSELLEWAIGKTRELVREEIENEGPLRDLDRVECSRADTDFFYLGGPVGSLRGFSFRELITCIRKEGRGKEGEDEEEHRERLTAALQAAAVEKLSEREGEIARLDGGRKRYRKWCDKRRDEILREQQPDHPYFTGRHYELETDDDYSLFG